MDKKELQILHNALNCEWTFKLILILLDKLGAFERGVSKQMTDREVFMAMAKREKGLWLLDCIYQANQDKYLAILQEKEKTSDGQQ